MATFGEVLIVLSFAWLILIAVANRVDLTKYKLFVSSGFLLYMPTIFHRGTVKVAKAENFWVRFGNYALFPTILLFLSVPLVLLINLIQGIFFTLSPIFITDVISIFRIEIFVLILPPLAVFLSIQLLINAIFGVIEDKEVDKAGILLVGFVFTFFATLKGKVSKYKLQALSTITVLNLLVLLMAFPLGLAVDSMSSSMYEESQGAIITYIQPNSPAAGSTLKLGDVITQVTVLTENFGRETTNITSSALLNQVLSQIPASTQFVIGTLDSQLSISGVSPPNGVSQASGSYLGLTTEDYRPSKSSFLSPLLPFWLHIFLDWMINLGLLFGIYSLLPLPKSPGYQLMGELVRKFELDISVKSQQIISVVFSLVLAANILFFVL